MQFYLEIITCDPLNYTMYPSKFIAPIQKEEFISSFKGSANYYSTAKSELHVYDETPNLVFRAAATCSKSCKFL